MARPHGRSGPKDPLYIMWKNVKQRCFNPKHTAYRWYGGRGISVWEPWRTDADAFITYIEENLGPRPKGCSIDRIDNDGDYAPGNLRWATRKEQVANSRNRR